MRYPKRGDTWENYSLGVKYRVVVISNGTVWLTNRYINSMIGVSLLTFNKDYFLYRSIEETKQMYANLTRFTIILTVLAGIAVVALYGITDNMKLKEVQTPEHLHNVPTPIIIPDNIQLDPPGIQQNETKDSKGDQPMPRHTAYNYPDINKHSDIWF